MCFLMRSFILNDLITFEGSRISYIKRFLGHTLLFLNFAFPYLILVFLQVSAFSAPSLQVIRFLYEGRFLIFFLWVVLCKFLWFKHECCNVHERIFKCVYDVLITMFRYNDVFLYVKIYCFYLYEMTATNNSFTNFISSISEVVRYTLRMFFYWNLIL